ncbi:CDP-glycerol glycerophosphotransferase family protein [Nonomuraea sp. NPDC050663]|uniref:CDP-glycerol glycerophosphotransferase family protein n=1 Tax=Nonomuraea sp. NPDC050663 TaxID=3364370 RepID=UPI0037A722B0
MLLAALWPEPTAFLVTILISYLCELALRGRSPALLTALCLRPRVRPRLREFAALCLLIRVDDAVGTGAVVLAVALWMANWLWPVCFDRATALAKRQTRQPPIVTRNLGPRLTTGGKPAPIAVPRTPMEALLVISAALCAVTGTFWFVAAAAAAQFVLAALVTVRLARRLRGLPPIDDQQVLDDAGARLAAHDPQVILYFSGPDATAYQVNMWLSTLEQVDARVVVLLRERQVLRDLAPTTLPVVCIPDSVVMMNFTALDSAKVALFPANVGKNIHMLRVAGVRSVFIGHGDSDKEASFNPFSKVYDEIWVAGPAGRDRYLRAGIGVHPSRIVEVGRPQLTAITTERTATPTPTVLYAPTWEGWSDDLHHTSVLSMGPRLVRELIGRSVRVIYKPHPMTGTRDPRAGVAHEEIVRVIAGAGGDHQVVTGATPHLYDCFNQADLLIGDISSVVSEFIASGKPYAVTNVAGLPDEDFKQRYPTTAAAYLLTAEMAHLETILAACAQLDDPLAEERDRLRAYLLGPEHPGAPARFNEALNRLLSENRGDLLELSEIPAR